MFYLDPENHPTVRLKSYGATVKGATTTLKVELTITDHSELGYLLRQLAEIEQKQAALVSKGAGRKQAKEPLALPPPPRALTSAR